MGVTLVWRYLGGQVRATDVRDERQVEWPPHPGRVWLALAAQWFTGGRSPREQDVLETLRRAPEPHLWIPAQVGQPRQAVEVYVPVNDTAEGSSPLGFLPVGRTRQARYFPALHIGEGLCALHWPDLRLEPEAEAALSALAARLSYIGQASSMVSAWVATDLTPSPETLVLGVNPRPGTRPWYLRGFSCGFSLAELERWYQAGRPPLPRGFLPYTPISGPPAAARVPRAPVRTLPPARPSPFGGHPAGLPSSVEDGAAVASPWSPDLLFFLQISGAIFPVTHILRVVQALRQEITRRCPLPLPEWLTGHRSDGQSLRGNTWYTAVLPVGHIGPMGSNGRLVGLALARPRTVPPAEWERVLAPLMAPGGFRLTLQDGSRMVFERPAETLSGAFHPQLWIGGGSSRGHLWATVTPMVLDGRITGEGELAERVFHSVSYSCHLAGLPSPVEVVARRAPWWSGSFPAWGPEGSARCFPPDTRFQRRHLPRFHVWLRFPAPVQGPLALGRLRFQGYGLFWAVPGDVPTPRHDEYLSLLFGRGLAAPRLVVRSGMLPRGLEESTQLR